MSTKVKFELEYPLRSSNKVLFNSISTPDGLSEWFADNVNVVKDRFVFEWDGSEEFAKLIQKKPYESVKFQWDRDEEDENTVFEFHIKIDPLTNDLALIVIDHADESEVDDSTFLWNNLISKLKQKLGA